MIIYLLLLLCQSPDCCLESQYWRVCGCRDVINNTCCAEEGDILTYELIDNYTNFSRCFTQYQPFCTMFDGDTDCDIDLKDYSICQNTQSFQNK